MGTQELLNRVAENLSVRRAFGTPYEKNGLVIIPVALVAGGGGGGEAPTIVLGDITGVSDGSQEPDSGVSHGSDSGLASGSGGGFGGLVLPVGVFVVNGDDVLWKPAVDVTLIALASLSVLRLLMRLRTRVRLRTNASA